MKQIEIEISNLFKGIELLEKIEFNENQEYFQKEKIQIQNENGDWKNITGMITKKDKTRKISYDSGDTSNTALKHLILTKNGIKKVSDIDKNDLIVKADGTIIRMTKSKISGIATVYDFEIEDDNHLYQTANGIIHHNTELAKQMALYMFGSEESMIRFDMSEFQESYKLSRLIGSAPGYVGYEEGGQLTEKVRRKPYSIVLFDEIEKAHQDIFNVLLQVFDDGILTDSLGRKVDFKNTIIIMTSNVGTRFLKDNNVMGFASNENENNEKTRNIINKAMKDKFPPEFLNRIDEIVIFHKLEKDDLLKILDIQLRILSKRMALQEINIDFDETVRNFLIQFDESESGYGARPLKRAIQKHLENFISENILKENIKPGIAYMITRKDDKMIVMLKNEIETVIKATEKKKKKRIDVE
jgi:hypothetical protein